MSRFAPCELKAMASESDMGCPLRIIVLVGGYEQGGRSPKHPPKLSGDDKAQNDMRLASNVGLGVAPVSARCLQVSNG